MSEKKIERIEITALATALELSEGGHLDVKRGDVFEVAEVGEVSPGKVTWPSAIALIVQEKAKDATVTSVTATAPDSAAGAGKPAKGASARPQTPNKERTSSSGPAKGASALPQTPDAPNAAA